jgi:hypothetical protein
MSRCEVRSLLARAAEAEYSRCLNEGPQAAREAAEALIRGALVELGRNLLLADHGWEPVSTIERSGHV